MKKFTLGIAFLLNILVNAAEIKLEYGIPDTSLVIKIVDYNQDIVTQFHTIMYKFHKQDMETSSEELRSLYENKLAERLESFKSGKSSLLLVYKNSSIVGGTYYFTEGTESVMRLGGTSIDTDALNIEESSRALGAIMVLLASKSLLPDSNKLVFFLPINSEKIVLAKHFGFTECNYPLPPEFPGAQFCAFEKLRE